MISNTTAMLLRRVLVYVSGLFLIVLGVGLAAQRFSAFIKLGRHPA